MGVTLGTGKNRTIALMVYLMLITNKSDATYQQLSRQTTLMPQPNTGTIVQQPDGPVE